jgi:bifunctional DNA-binding transcriptional regulator/antitoxin component of YhaV-PrlF toxin-antitoxin module
MPEQVAIKEIDDQGRIVIPKQWRRGRLRTNKVVMKLKENSIEIVPYESLDLTKHFDSVVADVKSNLSDWRSLKKEILTKKR